MLHMKLLSVTLHHWQLTSSQSRKERSKNSRVYSDDMILFVVWINILSGQRSNMLIWQPWLQSTFTMLAHLQHSNKSTLVLFELEDADENSSLFIIIKINSISCLLMDHLISPEGKLFFCCSTWRCSRHRGVPISDCRSRAGGCGGRACAVDGGLQTQGSWAGHGCRGNSGGEARTSQGCWGLYFHLSHALFLEPNNKWQLLYVISETLIISDCYHVTLNRL